MENFDIYRLDGHTLNVFLKVCETGSVSQTADVFDLNQSTISHTLDKMRAAVGDPLFVKSGRGITPTEKSLSLIPKVQKILGDIQGLIESDTYDVSRETRPISVALPTPALMDQMKSIHRKLRALAPDVLFQVARLAPRERLADMLIGEEVDVAIAVNTKRFPAILNSTSFGGDKLVVYYDPDQRGPLRNVDDYQKALHGVAGFGGKSKSIVDLALEELGLQRKIGFVAPTASALGEFLVGTNMIATMPLGLATSAYSELAYCQPPLTLPPLEYDLVWHRRFEHSGRNRWIRELLLENAPAAQAA